MPIRHQAITKWTFKNTFQCDYHCRFKRWVLFYEKPFEIVVCQMPTTLCLVHLIRHHMTPKQKYFAALWDEGGSKRGKRHQLNIRRGRKREPVHCWSRNIMSLWLIFSGTRIKIRTHSHKSQSKIIPVKIYKSIPVNTEIFTDTGGITEQMIRQGWIFVCAQSMRDGVILVTTSLTGWEQAWNQRCKLLNFK